MKTTKVVFFFCALRRVCTHLPWCADIGNVRDGDECPKGVEGEGLWGRDGRLCLGWLPWVDGGGRCRGAWLGVGLIDIAGQGERVGGMGTGGAVAGDHHAQGDAGTDGKNHSANHAQENGVVNFA